jgi:hypothetical protein
MQTSEIIQHAHALYRAHGDKAEAEAAQKAKAAEDPATAEAWQKIRMKIRELRGPNAK